MSLLDVISWPPATLPPEKKPQFDFFSQSRRVRENELFCCSMKQGPPQGMCACGSSILSEGEGPQLGGEALGGVASICTGDFEFLSSSFLPLPLPPVPLPPSTTHFPLPALHFLLSFSTIDPKSSFWIQGGQDSQIPPHTPRPQCPSLGQGLQDSFISSGQHSA